MANLRVIHARRRGAPRPKKGRPGEGAVDLL